MVLTKKRKKETFNLTPENQASVSQRQSIVNNIAP